MDLNKTYEVTEEEKTILNEIPKYEYNQKDIEMNPIKYEIPHIDDTSFLKADGTYDLLRVYELIDFDVEKISYKKNSSEYYELIRKWNKHTPAYKNMNRVYSWFHQLHSDERELFTIKNSHLMEAFDIPACNFVILGKLLETVSIDKDELSRFQYILRYEYIYEKIGQFLGLNLNDESIKKSIKTSCQHWLNIRKCKLHTGSWNDDYFTGIDNYFKTNFPSIYDAIINWREDIHNGKPTKMLWNDFQKVEFEIISKNICTYLHIKYNVFPVSVHDAVYLSRKDRAKISENLEDIFWKELNFKYIEKKTNKLPVQYLVDSILEEEDLSTITVQKVKARADYEGIKISVRSIGQYLTKRFGQRKPKKIAGKIHWYYSVSETGKIDSLIHAI